MVFESCSPSYVPNVVNTPLLSNKGEVQMGVHTGFSGIDPQLAYAVTNHFGLMLNGSFANRTSDSTDNYHKHRFGEMGVGYFTEFLDNGRFEVFTGFGAGDLRANLENGLFYSFSDVNANRFFIQPAIGAKTNVFDASFAPRLVLINLRQGQQHLSAVLIEPTITAKLGYKYVKAVFQFGISIPVSSTENYFYQPFLLSIGLQGFIGALTKKD